MKNTFTLFLCLSFLFANAQQKVKIKECQNITSENGNEKLCFHANGQVSTKEMWDNNHYWGKFVMYKNDGKEILHYELRRVGGHASVYPTYHANGQVHKLEFSSAPDGGIQFYNYFHAFDEAGNQTEYVDLSRPDGYPTTIIKSPDFQKETEETYVVNQKKIEKKTTNFFIHNEARKSIKIKLIAQKNTLFQFKNKEITIKPKSTQLIDSVQLSSMFLDQKITYEVEIIDKKKNKYKLILEEKVENADIRNYNWYLFEK
jgi:hypothetical protein